MTKHLTQSAVYALVASTVIVSLTFMAFFVAEPVISHGQGPGPYDFTITQTITDETSFLVPPTNVIMDGGINGVTGGNATGTTQFVIISNNSAGYNVTMSFANVGSEAMYGDETGDESLRDYGGDVGGQPSYNWTASTAAQFAYTVTSSTTGDTAQSFLNDGLSGPCNAGGTDSEGLFCWKSPDTVAFTIVDRGDAATTGATSTIVFKVSVPSGATPIPQAETYTATATLSLSIN